MSSAGTHLSKALGLVFPGFPTPTALAGSGTSLLAAGDVIII